LLAIVALLVASARQAAGGMLRTLLAVLAALFAFVLLEEVDYGRHFVEYLSGEVGPLSPEHWNRNVHNRVTAEGVQYASYMRLGANVLWLPVSLWRRCCSTAAGGRWCDCCCHRAG
jgi:hypothetical protein